MSRTEERPGRTVFRLRKLSAAGLLLLVAGQVLAGSNIAPERALSWACNLGWLNWRPDASTGVEVGQFICSGYIYSPNVGWISLGDGAPENRIQYQNNSATDFGVIMDLAGRLRGYAYGANIGWIRFEDTGGARVDLKSGALTGYAYSANTGWIELGNVNLPLTALTIAAGTDSDTDGMPDAWELTYADTLQVFTALSDFDQDGQSDLQEYLADTDPFDPDDRLQVIATTLPGDKARLTLSWTSKPTRNYLVEVRSGLNAQQGWSDAGLGEQASTGTRTSRTIPLDPGHEFFRIRAVRPLSGKAE